MPSVLASRLCVRPRHSGLAAVALAAVALVAAGCGAKTGLLVPEHVADAAIDAPDDTFERFEACVAGRFDMRRRTAEMLLVIDRSGSMNDVIGGGTSGGRDIKWIAVQDVLSQTLPEIESTIDLGALFFPRVPSIAVPTPEENCGVLSHVDVPLGPDHAGEVLRAFAANPPNGATPTYEGLRVAGDVLVADTDRWRAKYLLLATDGAPNCDADLDPNTCVCLDVDPSGNPVCAGPWMSGVYSCLDDGRTVQKIDELARRGIFTYVIGIDDPNAPALSDVLNRMAVAGQRTNPNGGALSYYSARRREDLSAAFAGISRTLLRCAYVTPSRPDDPDAIQVTVDGAVIPHDPTRQNGWDWSDRDFGEVTFYGPACDRVTGQDAIQATVMCR